MGRECIVRIKPQEAPHTREQGWNREIKQADRELKGGAEFDSACTAAQNLCRMDLPSEDAFSVVGGRLLRAPGALPSLPSASAGECPLAVRPRVGEGEVTLSQEARRSATESQDGSQEPASGSEKRRRLADTLVARQQRMAQLRILQKSLVKGHKAVESLVGHNNFQAHY